MAHEYAEKVSLHLALPGHTFLYNATLHDFSWDGNLWECAPFLHFHLHPTSWLTLHYILLSAKMMASTFSATPTLKYTGYKCILRVRMCSSCIDLRKRMPFHTHTNLFPPIMKRIKGIMSWLIGVPFHHTPLSFGDYSAYLAMHFSRQGCSCINTIHSLVWQPSCKWKVARKGGWVLGGSLSSVDTIYVTAHHES